MRRLEEILHQDKFSFEEVKSKSEIIVQDPDKKYDVSFIIPVKGRTEFMPILYDAFQKASAKSDKEICFTVSEFSDKQEHKEFCQEHGLNYIYIPCNQNDLFNKCLAMNCAVLWSADADYYLFHDLDCIMQSDFFNNLFENWETKGMDKYGAMQTFNARRVLYCNLSMTEKILEGGFDYDTLELDNMRVTMPAFVGAPGGSICIKKQLFFDIGGYDHLFFQANSPEDAHFWKKIETISRIAICDNPINELYHLNHPVTYHSNPKDKYMKELHRQFLNVPQVQREQIVELTKRKFQEWMGK